MISRDQAIELVSRQLDELGRGVSGGLQLQLEHTIERPYGWVFFYQSKTYCETGDPMAMLFGNSPIVVERADGRVTFLGTSTPVDVSLRKFEARGRDR